MPERANRADRIKLRAVLWGAVIVAAAIVVAGVSAWVAFVTLRPGHVFGPNEASGPLPAVPRLESAPQIDRVAYFAEKDKRLHGYGWVDRDAGIAHIPVEQAMRMLAARGGKP